MSELQNGRISEENRNYSASVESGLPTTVTINNEQNEKRDDVEKTKSMSFDIDEEPTVISHINTSLADWQGCFHLIKATIGTGILAMPSATKNAGIVLGPLSIFLTGAIVLHAMALLVKCAQYLRKQFLISPDVDIDYVETVDYTLKFSSVRFRKYFFWLPHYLRFGLLSYQIGLLSVYLSFVAENTKYMVDHYDPNFKQPVIFYQGIVFLFLIPMAAVTSLRQLAKFSGFANILALLSIMIALIYFITHQKLFSQLPKVQNFSTIPMSFGVSVFAFESITLVLPVENRLKNKKSLLGFGGILNLSIVPSICLFTAMAFYGYLSAGDDIKGSFTYNVPMTPWYFMIVKPMYTVSIYISYGLQFFITLKFIDDVIDREKMSKRMPILLYEIIQRGSLSVIVFLLASLVPHVDLMISLVGAFSGSAIALQYPAILHAVLVYGSTEAIAYRRCILAKDLIVFLIGMFGAIIGTYTSIVSIVNTFH